jgi:hypothetical protein
LCKWKRIGPQVEERIDRRIHVPLRQHHLTVNSD